MTDFLRPFLLILALATLAAPAQAQRWTAATTEADGAFFADAAPPGRGIAFHCGGGTVPPGPQATPTNQIALTIAPETLAAAEDSRRDLALVIDGRPFWLPQATRDPATGAHLAMLDIDDPVFAALRKGRRVALAADSVEAQSWPLSGSSAAIRDMALHCVRRWQDPAGPPLPFTSPLRPGDPSDPVVTAAVTRHFADWCPSGPDLDPTAIVYGDLDGDGQDDAVVDASGYVCDGMRPSCGAAFCSAYVFLSSRGMAFPLDYLTIGLALTEAGGQTALRLDYAMSTCSNPFVLEGCTSQTLVYRDGAMRPAGE